MVDDPWSGQAASLVFQGLWAYDQDLNLVPVLANGMPTVSEGGRTYTITLEERARFQNDSAVLAEDVKYSFRPGTYERSESPNVWQVEMIESIRTPDRRTVEFTLQYPYPAFEHTLTRAVVPKASRQAAPETFGHEKPVGFGPYEIEILKPRKYAVLEEWDDYWGPVGPKVESVKMIPNHAGLSRTMSLKTGQNAIVERVQPKLWYQTETRPAGRIEWSPSFHSPSSGSTAATNRHRTRRSARRSTTCSRWTTSPITS